MFKHILVPLDGSKLAEAALPAAWYLGRVLGAQVTLIHVVEIDAPFTVHGDRHLTNTAEAEAYLAAIASPRGLTVARHVHSSACANVPQSIVAHQSELVPDLIIMCTHGRSGLKRILIGSIAQQVVASGNTPVLLIRPDHLPHQAAFEIQSLLAPLDGQPAHEAGLTVAAALARATDATLLILSVVPTTGNLAGRDATTRKFMPGTTRAILRLAEEDLTSYLETQASKLREQGLSAVSLLRHGDTSSNIAAEAENQNAGAIVLATHGKAGAEAFWTQSVAARVQAQTERPLLLVPV